MFDATIRWIRREIIVGVDNCMVVRAHAEYGVTKAIIDVIYVFGCKPILG